MERTAVHAFSVDCSGLYLFSRVYQSLNAEMWSISVPRFCMHIYVYINVRARDGGDAQEDESTVNININLIKNSYEKKTIYVNDVTAYGSDWCVG